MQIKRKIMILFPVVLFILLLTSCDMIGVVDELLAFFINRSDCYGGTKIDVLYDIIETTDGNYLAVGQSFSNDGDLTDNKGASDVWILKLSMTGAIIWDQNYGGSDYDIANAVIQTNDGGYVVAGQTASNDEDVGNNHGGYDFWVLRLDANGLLKWESAFGGSNNEYAFDLCKTTDGCYMVAGFTKSSDGDVTGYQGNDDCWIVKVNDTGALVWQKTLGGGQADRAYSICSTHDTGFLIGGSSRSSDGDVSDNNGGNDAWLVKVDQVGNIVWEKNFGGSNIDLARAVFRTPDNGFIVGGETESTDQDVTGNHGNKDGWLLKLVPNGNLTWAKCYGGTDDDDIRDVIQTANGGYAFLGASNSSDEDVPGNRGDFDFLFMVLDENGDIKWTKNYGGASTEIGNSLIEKTDGGFILVGNSYSTDGDVTGNHGLSDCWVLEINRQ